MEMHNPDHLPKPWSISAAYLYTLNLDGPALAWEYLRRHAGYLSDWLALGRNGNGERWGLRQRRRPKPRCP